VKTRPTRTTKAGQIYLDLQNLARRTQRPTDELHQLYALEGFLARLAGSDYSDRLVLKGGVLLAAYDTRRPTRDVDLLAQRTDNNTEVLLTVVRAIALVQLDDGITFDADSAVAETIRDEDSYSGVRVMLRAELSAAQLYLHVDINVGDPVDPDPVVIVLPRLLGDGIELLGYPLAMVHAEKIVTALERGIANTRWRDFADIYLLSRQQDLDGDELHRAITAVSGHRLTAMVPLSEALAGYAARAQARWMAWRRKQRLDDRLPADFDDVLRAVCSFADTALSGDSVGRTWSSAQSRWQIPP